MALPAPGSCPRAPGFISYPTADGGHAHGPDDNRRACAGPMPPTVADCGHDVGPWTGWVSPYALRTAKADQLQVSLCRACATSAERLDLAATPAGQRPPVALYLSSDRERITGFGGDALAAVVSAMPAGNRWAHDLLRLRARLPDGRILVGTGQPGMYCRLRIAKGA